MKIPDIATGSVIPPKIEADILKQEQEARQRRISEIRAWITTVIAVLGFVLSIIALVTK